MLNASKMRQEDEQHMGRQLQTCELSRSGRETPGEGVILPPKPLSPGGSLKSPVFKSLHGLVHMTILNTYFLQNYIILLILFGLCAHALLVISYTLLKIKITFIVQACQVIG